MSPAVTASAIDTARNMPSPSSPPQRALAGLARLQVDRPGLVVLLVLLLTLPAALAASGLGLKTDFAELLPDNKPSVVEMRRVSSHLASTATLTIVAEGNDTAALRSFVDQAAPKLRALGPEWVGAVDDGVQDAQRFLDENKLLYASYDDIKKLHDEVLERYDEEVGKATGTDLGLDDDEEPRATDAGREPITGETVRARIAEARKRVDEHRAKYPGGYYLGEDGHIIIMFVRTPISGGNADKAPILRAKVEQIVAEVNPQRLDPSMKVAYTGDFITSAEEIENVKSDLVHVGFWGVSLVLAAVLLFFLRFRTLIAMAITIAVGLVWTFGAARVAVGYLNSSTGFLVSIIAGNGINVGIIYMARYLEARRAQHRSVSDAIRIAHADTWLATLAASAAAMVAYGSLATTDFRGFKHFGIIGGLGMLLCWVATFVTLPPILVMSERLLPMFVDPNALRSRARGVYGLAFAWLAARAPRPIVIVALLTGIASAWFAVRYATSDPMEYDLQNISTDRHGKTPARKLSTRVDAVVGRMGQDGMAVMVDRVEQVALLTQVLEKRLADAPEDRKPFEKVVSLFSLLPDRQAEKIELINEVLDRIHRARDKGFIDDKQWAEIEPELPKRPLVPLTIHDMPEKMARPFTEQDGTRGRIVYIVPKVGRSIWDGHYLDLWANSYREVTLPTGEKILGSGSAVVWSDMLAAVREDSPKAIFVSLIGTLVVVVLAFRLRRESWIVLGVVLLGLCWLVAYMYLREVKLNFLNFVALPITFGVGADYAVNMTRRLRLEGYRNVRDIVVETGGAVVLCSLTTMLGYIALMFSMNRAIRSFGLVAAIGEVTTLVAAVLVLPAFVLWRQHRKPVAVPSQDRA